LCLDSNQQIQTARIFDRPISKDIRFKAAFDFGVVFDFELFFGFEPMLQIPAFRLSFGKVNAIGPKLDGSTLSCIHLREVRRDKLRRFVRLLVLSQIGPELRRSGRQLSPQKGHCPVTSFPSRDFPLVLDEKPRKPSAIPDSRCSDQLKRMHSRRPFCVSICSMAEWRRKKWRASSFL
jgi:hypothetical protein